jgi:hypothetical protein
VISSVASFVDSVPVEIQLGFRLLGSFEFSDVLGLTVGKAIRVRARFILEPFGSLARRPKIDHLCHLSPPTHD